MHWHGLDLMRRAQDAIYKHGQSDRSDLVLAAWYDVLHMLLGFGQSAALQRPGYTPRLHDVAKTLVTAYALGRNASGDKTTEWAVRFMRQGALWSKEDWDPRWENKREPFARFAWACGLTLPTSRCQRCPRIPANRLLATICWPAGETPTYRLWLSHFLIRGASKVANNRQKSVCRRRFRSCP
jgi:hypothetical protein